MTRLFSVGPRKRSTIKKRNESMYCFLDTSGWPSIGRAREFWEGWFSQLNEAKKTGLAARFRSRNHHTHLSAFLELFTYALLKHSGHEVQIEPTAGSRNLDFLASMYERDVNFYAECTTTGQRADEAGADAREADVLEAINRLPASRFLLTVLFRKRGSRAPSTKHLCAQLTSWLASLDHAAALHELHETKRLNEWRWAEDDWLIKFSALPVETELKRHEGALGVIGTRFYWMQESSRLREAIDEKASKYGSLDAPLLVVINSTEYQQDDDLMRALVGDEVWDVDVLDKSASERIVLNGVFGSPRSPRNVQLSAVMHGLSDEVSFVSPESALVLVHHPFAVHPLPRNLFPFCEERYFDGDTGQTVATPPTMTVGEFFGLPIGWPFFDKDPHRQDRP